ncbi:hypothetical protein GOBAR_AA19416 [Gossypium barbadense]|uniref:Uncharacterized protein n=1 Tax=Gossypium barbadense TaxID=3634 RepID=A0A2P5XD47_GOSBA|nr:hypothetical protein GOBAR_AA19416 [Gossypium barbadense]
MGSTSNGASSTQKVEESLLLPQAAIACAAPLASRVLFDDYIAKPHFFCKDNSLKACIRFGGCRISNVVDRLTIVSILDFHVWAPMSLSFARGNVAISKNMAN